MYGQGSPPRVEAFYQVGVLMGWEEFMACKGAGPRNFLTRDISSHPCSTWVKMSYVKVSYSRARWMSNYI